MNIYKARSKHLIQDKDDLSTLEFHSEVIFTAPSDSKANDVFVELFGFNARLVYEIAFIGTTRLFKSGTIITTGRNYVP